MNLFILAALSTFALMGIIRYLSSHIQHPQLQIGLTLLAWSIYFFLIVVILNGIPPPAKVSWVHLSEVVTGDRASRVMLGIAFGWLAFLWLAARRPGPADAPPTLVLAVVFGFALVGPQFESQIARLSSVSTPVGELQFVSIQGERKLDPHEATAGTEWRTHHGPESLRWLLEELESELAFHGAAARYYENSGNTEKLIDHLSKMGQSK
jgi:hypothetical protein